MKIFSTLILLTSFLALNAQTASESRSVEGYTTLDFSAPSITVHWAGTANATGYKIYKRALGSTTWGSPIATLGTSDFEYKDAAVTIGTVYEYTIAKTTSTADPLAGGTMTGYSYLSAALQKPAKHSNGSILVLASKLITDSLSADVAVLLSDLSNDGWAASAEVINQGATVADVKAYIKSKKDAGLCDAVYLLGNIAVPYSGTFCTDNSYQSPPDGHTAAAPPSHCGAWPSDLYYGTFEGNWTDNNTDSTGARAENKNIPGDGKFDNNRLPGTVSLAIGRVDFSKLSAFNETEVQLTKRYLDKVHAFKIGETQVQNKGVIEDNFSGFAEGFSSSAIRNITAICGPNSIVRGDIFTNADTSDFLFSYTCGGGSYTTCNGVGTTNDYKTKNGAAFNFIFGSYFGDFDIDNNFMRASMATSKLGFGCIWSGRPKWIWHTMALGENYADIAKKSQNNWFDYDANYYQNGVHMNLLGDPSLRSHFIKPANDIVLISEDNDTKVKISWTASTETDILGYYIYRSKDEHGPYTLLTNNAEPTTTYTDASPLAGTAFYMVRAAKETTTGSGSYINLSLGTKNSIRRTVNIASLTQTNVKVYPTLANDNITLETTTSEAVTYTIVNTIGTIIYADKTIGSKTIVNVSNLESGVYLLHTGGSSHRFVKL
jgi:hypothetical protein